MTAGDAFQEGNRTEQLAVVALALLSMALLRRLRVQWPLPARLVPACLTGGCAGFSVCERLWPPV